MSTVRYQVVNTTVKPPKIDRKTGKDLRTTVERVGHAIGWRDSKGGSYALNPTSNPRIVTELTEGLIRLQRGGMASIRELKTFSDGMKDHVNAGKNEPASALVEIPQPETKVTAPEVIAPSNVGNTPAAETTKGSAVLMGDTPPPVKDDHVNPDGPNNFTVTAKRGGSGKKGRGKKNRRSEESLSQET